MDTINLDQELPEKQAFWTTITVGSGGPGLDNCQHCRLEQLLHLGPLWNHHHQVNKCHWHCLVQLQSQFTFQYLWSLSEWNRFCHSHVLPVCDIDDVLNIPDSVSCSLPEHLSFPTFGLCHWRLDYFRNQMLHWICNTVRSVSWCQLCSKNRNVLQTSWRSQSGKVYLEIICNRDPIKHFVSVNMLSAISPYQLLFHQPW